MQLYLTTDQQLSKDLMPASLLDKDGLSWVHVPGELHRDFVVDRYVFSTLLPFLLPMLDSYSVVLAAQLLASDRQQRHGPGSDPTEQQVLQRAKAIIEAISSGKNHERCKEFAPILAAAFFCYFVGIGGPEDPKVAIDRFAKFGKSHFDALCRDAAHRMP